MKCAAYLCQNHDHEGEFVGAFCAPCYKKITTGQGKYGTAWFYDLEQAIALALDAIETILEDL